MSDQLPGDTVILDHVRNNKDLEKNPNFLPMSSFIWLLPSNPPSWPTPVLLSHHAADTLAFLLFLRQVVPASGSWHVVFPLPRMPLSKSSMRLALFLYLDLSSTVSQKVLL